MNRNSTTLFMNPHQVKMKRDNFHRRRPTFITIRLEVIPTI
jgi:hypothetical protein